MILLSLRLARLASGRLLDSISKVRFRKQRFSFPYSRLCESPLLGKADKSRD